MATILFYEKPGCATNAKQKALLAAAGHTVIAKSLLTEPWDAARLRSFFGDLPVAAWFNRAAPRVKSGAVVPEALSETQALQLLLAEPLLIRRPLLEVEDKRVTGFEMERIAAWLGLEALTPVAEGCSHPHSGQHSGQGGCKMPDEK